jgi:hypothetical protein
MARNGAADRRPDLPQRLTGGRPRRRPTAAAAVCSNVWSRSAQRVGSRVGRPSASTGFSVMGRRARPKELLALDTPAPARVDGPGRGRNLRRQRTALPRGHSESCPGAAGGGRFLSKQTRLASEALAGESGSLDLLNVDEEAGESLETDQQPPDFRPRIFSHRFLRGPGASRAPRRLPVRRSGTATALTSPRWTIRQRLAHIRLGNPKMPRNP